ncbi:MAG TPA: PglZ domain-containing protein [Bacteroidia bacterium]|nr:PglZ domain-containing protein [Bacteroidia bacterium]HNT80417.1 PglZ domain-containing protein [Bacteroidia bacterium]
MDKLSILWADDEIEMLKAHILFLEQKGYDVTTVNNGDDALIKVEKFNYDIIFLDEHMPGLSGLETLMRIKNIKTEIPVVMITKSEEESIMEDAIGSKIADYLIKPVNPNQILLSLKKILDNRRLISEKTNANYLQDFRQIGITISDKLSHTEWSELYKKLVYWELELERSNDPAMYEILTTQKAEANRQFGKFIEKNYSNWINSEPNDQQPLLSHQLMAHKIIPIADQSSVPLVVLVIDNLRLDQFKIIQPLLQEHFRIESEETYFSILPTATQYARNALFCGLLPEDIQKRLPKMWLNDDDEGSKNQFESEFFDDLLKRLRKDYKFQYKKVTNYQAGKDLVDSIQNFNQYKINLIVYNFVDMLSHARTDMEVIRELAVDEAAYRSLTRSWFDHSPLNEALKKLSEKPCRLIITTDHGTIRVKNPSKVIGDRNTNTNLRYKQGKNLAYEKNEVLAYKNPSEIKLPKTNLSSSYIFAKEDMFFAYPNNYNHYVSFYNDTFQHGGVSLEEMIVPFVLLASK